MSGTITVATFKSQTAPNDMPKLSVNNGLILTVKQASLIALNILNEYTDIACEMELIVLTPLAGAICSRAEIPKMMDDEAIKKAFHDKIGELVKSINSSCQSGGHHLAWSRADIAAVAAYVATEGLKDKKLAAQTTNKTNRQYNTAKRPYDSMVKTVMAKFATGGVPSELSYETLRIEIPNIRRTVATDMAFLQTGSRTKEGGKN